MRWPRPCRARNATSAARQLAHHVVVRRRAEGRLDHDFFLRFKSGHGVEPAAADDSDFRFQLVLS